MRNVRRIAKNIFNFFGKSKKRAISPLFFFRTEVFPDNAINNPSLADMRQAAVDF